MLLDEPFSALDTKLRIELRSFVQSLEREVGTAALLVTHDHEEALELSDRIVVMRNGRVEEIGAPSDFYDSPRTTFVAGFFGAMNFLDGAGLEDHNHGRPFARGCGERARSASDFAVFTSLLKGCR